MLTLIKDDVPEGLRAEVAQALADAIDGGEDFELLQGLAMDMGLVCLWCGRLHSDPVHDALAKAYWAECAKCECHKSDMVCVKTGFRFLHVDSGRGKAGDLFWCPRHGTYAIFGVNRLDFDPVPGMSTYEGPIEALDGNFDVAKAGTITLNEEARDEDRRDCDVS